MARRSLARIVARALSFCVVVSTTSLAWSAGPTVDELTAVSMGPHDTAEQRDAVARAHFHLAELDEEARRYEAALAHYHAVITIDPGNWFAGTARARIEALKQYDLELPWLSRLDSVRKDPVRANDPASIEALERDLETFPAGRARTEASLFVAEAWAGRLDRPERAIAPALRVARDATADEIARATGYELAYSAMHALGQLDRADREIARDPAAPLPIVRRIERDLLRRTLHRLSGTSLGFGAGLLIGGFIETARRRRFSIARATLLNRYALSFLLVAGLGAFALAEAWERGAGAPFLAVAGVLGGVHVLVAAVRGGFGDRSVWLRSICALGAAACVLAAAYLVLERGEALGRPMLAGFGL